MVVLDDPKAAFQAGNACLDRGDPRAAIAAFERCLALEPDNPVALFNLAHAQREAGNLFEAAETLVRCLHRAPAFPEAHINLAHMLTRLGLLEEARPFADIAVRLAPHAPEPLLCLAAILHHTGEHAAVVAACRRALRLAPDHAGALSSLGNALDVLGRWDEALAMHDRAVAASAPDDPAHATYRTNRAMTRLASGDFLNGFAENEWRWRRPGCRPRFAAPPWCGEDLSGSTILLHAEQGFGDTLQFVRYAPLVAARGGRVILQVRPKLIRLLRALPGVAGIVAESEPPPPFAWHCPLLSLPRAFATTLDTIPAGVPYLAADLAQVAQWRAFWSAAAPRGVRVGLVWAGAQHNDSWEGRLLDQRRSLRPADLAALADVPRVTYVSLQKDGPPPRAPVMLDVMDQMNDFADTAALIETLDLVISVDTSVAHLAGALGRPVWLLSRHDGCWRWLGRRPDSPWYPTMRLYHQTTPQDWPDVIGRVRGDLIAFAQAFSGGAEA